MVMQIHKHHSKEIADRLNKKWQFCTTLAETRRQSCLVGGEPGCLDTTLKDIPQKQEYPTLPSINNVPQHNTMATSLSLVEMLIIAWYSHKKMSTHPVPCVISYPIGKITLCNMHTVITMSSFITQTVYFLHVSLAKPYQKKSIYFSPGGYKIHTFLIPFKF